MATEALKSGAITNRDATPQVKNSSFLEGGLLRESVGTVEMTTADLGSTYRMLQVPSNCRISQLLLFSDDVGTTGLIDIGVYRTTADGGAVVDQDFFASAVDIKTAALNSSDVTYEAATAAGQIDDIEKPLWQQLGLTADPSLMYDVVITSTEAASAGGTLSLRVRYVV
jgi:hypothetical protein